MKWKVSSGVKTTTTESQNKSLCKPLRWGKTLFSWSCCDSLSKVFLPSAGFTAGCSDTPGLRPVTVTEAKQLQLHLQLLFVCWQLAGGHSQSEDGGCYCLHWGDYLWLYVWRDLRLPWELENDILIKSIRATQNTNKRRIVLGNELL